MALGTLLGSRGMVWLSLCRVRSLFFPSVPQPGPLGPVYLLLCSFINYVYLFRPACIG